MFFFYCVLLTQSDLLFWRSHPQGQSPSIRQLIMHSMAEWYMRGEQYDQAKLSRILDVAQDLKVYLYCLIFYLFSKKLIHLFGKNVFSAIAE